MRSEFLEYEIMYYIFGKERKMFHNTPIFDLFIYMDTDM